MVKRDFKELDFYFAIYSYIKEGLYPKQIADRLKTSKQKINYYIRILKANGFIQKIGKGAWVCSKTFDLNTLKLHSKNSIRTHAFIFSLAIPKNLLNWNNRKDFMKKNNINFKPFKNRTQEQIIFRNHKIQLSDKKIVVYIPKWRSYFVKSAKIGRNFVIYDFLQLIKGLERLFNISLKINKNYKFKIGRRHHGLIHNELAKMYNRNHEKLYLKSEKGFIWGHVDNSKYDDIGLDELEFYKEKDADTINHQFNFLKKDKYFFENIKSNQEEVKQVLDVLNKNIVSLVKNQAYIIKILKDRGDK